MSLDHALATLLFLLSGGTVSAFEASADDDIVGCYEMELTPARLPVTVTGTGGFTMDPVLPSRVRLTPALHPDFPADKQIHVAVRLDAATSDPRQTWQRLEDGSLVLWMADGAYALRAVFHRDGKAWTGTARSESEIFPIEFMTGTALMREMDCPASARVGGEIRAP